MATTPNVTSASTAATEHADLPPSVWRILASNFAEATHLLRFEEPLDGLDSSQWSVLMWIATSWTRGDQSPSQAYLASRSRLSTRTVRRALVALEELDLLRTARGTGVTTELEVGPRLALILRDFTFCRDPKIWMRTPRVGAGGQTLALTTPENGAGASEGTPANETVVHGHTTDNDAGVSERTAANETVVHAHTTDNDAGVSEGTPANETVVHGHTTDNGAGVSEGTPANGTVVHTRTTDNGTLVGGRDRQAKPQSPAPFSALISGNLKGIRIDASPDADAAAEGGPSVRQSGAPEGPPSLIKERNKEDLNSFSLEGAPTPDTVTAPATPATVPTPAAPAPAQPVDAGTARRLALDALAARFRRAHPGVPLPRAADAADVKLVEACTANGTWDVETLRQTHLDAIEGAFEKAPPERPPTPKYIWGQFRFFLRHASVGRAKRVSVEAPKPKSKQPRPPEDPPASSEWLEQHMRDAAALLDRLPDISTKPKPQTWARFVVEPE